MKLKINRITLYNACRKISGAVGIADKKAKIQSVTGILLEADQQGQNLKLTATDTSLTMQLKLSQVEVIEGGKALVEAKLFTGMLGALQEETVTIDCHNNLMVLQSGSPIFTVSSMDADSFPMMTPPLASEMVRVSGLSEITGKASFVASNSDDTSANPLGINCGGVYLKLSEETSTATATNGVMFAKAKGQNLADGSLEVFMPQRAVKLLTDTAKDIDTLYACVKNNCITFIGQGYMLCSRVLGNNLEMVEKLLARVSPKYGVVVNAKEFAEALDLCVTLNRNSDDSVDLRITDEGISLQTANQNCGYDTVVDGEKCVATADKLFRYKPTQLLSFAKRSSGPLKISIDENGIMKLSANLTDYVVMPLRERKIKEQKSQNKQPKKRKGKAA